MKRLRAFFYVQHLLGIGHLARASRIAAALVDDGFDVTVVTGGAPIAGFPGPGVKSVTLPPVTSGDEGFSALVDLQGKPIDDDFKKCRSEMLLQAFRDCRPDIVIVEAFPFGRRQMRFELLPLIEAIEATSPRPLLATSVRDILQERVKPGRDEETVDLVNRHFDLVMVHGDPAFATIDKTFPLAGAIRTEVTYTGLVAAPPPPAAAERFDVLVSVGGGAAGKSLVSSTIAAARKASNAWKWCLITGPNLPKDEFDPIARDATPGLSIFRFREDFASLLTGARLSVSQAGYNTVCDVLRAGCRSLLVPFAAGGETEQTVRALMLEELGLATVLMEKDLTPGGLAQAIEQALVGPTPSAHRLDLEGARRSAQILRERYRTWSLKGGPDSGKVHDQTAAGR
ncbi:MULTISPECIES: glycosyltransferase family protein [Mesorhizobium]|uniref:Glycosyltransferase n=1 Tax=Mesorhizobium shonense TaxID=1209948 RepID=A0ABV2HRI0_9HYPH|nr:MULTISPECIES: glycosyltransferase family protein [unclassified Mesorhizobium]AZO32201.1 glycosyl transferase [Mesorhizobium sp. M1B.F.Ca.ET.045.04.1.1]RWB18764.1 MAG: glycosyl transferase [Mesorhizobium sp.]RWE01128.1 MAG: glycosyl transferase [Mesorhizobium sp.]